MSNRGTVADKLPLVTVVPDKAFAGRRALHLLTDEKADLAGSETTALRFERLCGLEPAQYYFASLIEPDFGVVGLVYSPEIEKDQPGDAHPYDTGGTLDRACHPFDEMESDQTLKESVEQLQNATHVRLTDWRKTAADYLEDFYSSPSDYVRGKRPDREPDDVHSLLPALFHENDGDRRAYTWEVRICEKLRLDQGLIRWGTDVGTRNALERMASDAPVPTSSASGATRLWNRLDEINHVVDDVDTDALADLQRWLEAEMLS